MFGVGSARWPDWPPGAESCTGLIPVSGVGVVVDDFKTGGNGVTSRTPRSDMVVDGMTCEKHKGSLKYLEPMQVHWMNCAKCDMQRENVRMRGYGEVLSVHSPVAFMTVATVWTRNLLEKKSHG